jgi:phosphopantothenoylcysteine synthetase/decarboxylase
MKKVVILGGGTFEPIRNHLALSAPAFGNTAIQIHKLIPGSELVLTKMADRDSNLKSNSDVEKYIDELLLDTNVGTIVLNVAFCDFKSLPIDGIENGFHSDRLKTAEGNLTLELTPTDKVIAKIRQKRPDIFLIGFKTTTNKTSDEQFLIALIKNVLNCLYFLFCFSARM